MKCRNCDREALYDDGLCEECHRRAAGETERVQILSQEERESFCGQTIDEDGSSYSGTEKKDTVFDTMFRDQRTEQARSKKRVLFHVFGLDGLSIKQKLMIGGGIAVLVLLLIAAIFLFVTILPYILLGLLALFVIRWLMSAIH